MPGFLPALGRCAIIRRLWQEAVLQVHVLDEGELGPFQDFIRDSPYGDVLQLPAWARLKSESGWRAHYLAAEDDGRVVGVCLALERKLPKLPFTLLYCPRGPVLDWDNPVALAPLTQSLKELAGRRKSILIKIDPAVRTSHGVAGGAIDSAGFRRIESEGFGGTQPKCVMKLDLSGGLDAALESFKPKWRYNIRLAERKGVTVRDAGEEGLEAFYGILLETAKRDKFLVRGREYFKSMWRELNQDGLIKLFLAEYEGAPIAGALTYFLGKQAWYTYGASSNEHRNVMPNHLMQWRMMEAAHAAGCTVYDFRGVSCNLESLSDDNLQGLNRFKAGFNAEFIQYVGEYDLPINSLLYAGWTKVAPAALGLLKKRARAADLE